MKRDQFTFYRSYYEALKHLSKRDQTAVLLAVIGYALDETAPSLTGVPLSVFTLIRPTLDSGRNKARNRTNKMKSKQEQSNNKKEQTRKESEGEKEREVEVEREVESENDSYYKNSPPVVGEQKDPAAAEVVADYLDRINPSASPASLDELRAYAAALGPAVCKRAFDIALDEKKATWSYIRAILRDKQAKGVRSLADWEAVESRHKPPTRKGGVVYGAEAAPASAKKAMDDLDAFLAREEGGP